MRKVIYGLNITLDGCCDHTKGIPDEELHGYFTRLLKDVDTIAYGRKTYALMFPFWPDMAKNHSGPTQALNDFANAFAAIQDVVVFSRTLDKVEGQNARIVRSSPGDEIRKLKQEPGKSIMLGGVDIPSQLIGLGLVDEFHFVVHPIIAGAGRRLMSDTALPDTMLLKLVGQRTFKSGCVALHYLRT